MAKLRKPLAYPVDKTLCDEMLENLYKNGSHIIYKIVDRKFDNIYSERVFYSGPLMKGDKAMLVINFQTNEDRIACVLRWGKGE